MVFKIRHPNGNRPVPARSAEVLDAEFTRPARQADVPAAASPQPAVEPEPVRPAAAPSYAAGEPVRSEEVFRQDPPVRVVHEVPHPEPEPRHVADQVDTGYSDTIDVPPLGSEAGSSTAFGADFLDQSTGFGPAGGSDTSDLYDVESVEFKAEPQRKALFGLKRRKTAAAPVHRRRSAGGGFAMLTIIASLAIGLGAAWYANGVYVEWQQASDAARTETDANTQLNASIAKTLEGSVAAYARTNTLQVLPAFDKLEQLYVAGALGRVKADRESGVAIEYSLAAPDSSALAAATAAFQAKPLPPGCSGPSVATEGGNVLKARFVCQADRSGGAGHGRG